MDTHQWTAVIGTGRLVSIQAPDENTARRELIKQLSKNPQRREILAQWQTSGAKLVEQPSPPPFDEALANARIRAKLQVLLAELALRATRTGPIPESAPVFYAIDDAREALTAYARRTNR